MSVCLNMIVKNEAHVIRRCLESVAPFIDNWVIVDDTESTDGTDTIIREFMLRAGKPGELHKRAWQDFGANRTEAFELARDKADYVLMLDADEVFIAPEAFRWPKLERDGYQLRMRSGASDVHFWLTKLVRAALPWQYRGAYHEAIYCDVPHNESRLQGPLIHGLFDSAQNQVSQVEKYTRHAVGITKALEKDPNNARYVFYLGQSWRDAKQYEKSIEAYRRRARMGGWEEEVWYSEFQVARNLEWLGRRAEAIEAYLKAYQRRPTRAEPLCELARMHRESGELWPAYLFASTAARIDPPNDTLFVDEGVYRWRSLDELSVAAYWVGKYAESAEASRSLLDQGVVPADHQARVKQNLRFAIEKLEQKRQ
jgi:glycosyltransferase involved in cell wall biosynthesis